MNEESLDRIAFELTKAVRVEVIDGHIRLWIHDDSVPLSKARALVLSQRLLQAVLSVG